MRAVALLPLLLTVPLSAQEIIELPDGSVVLMGELLAEPVRAASGDEGSEAAEAPSPRIERFGKLTFDRRPSAMLAAWADPPEPVEAPEPEAPDPGLDEEARAAAEEAARKAAEAAALEQEFALFQRRVTLGRWAELREYLEGLTEEEARAALDRLLANLVQGPPKARSPFANWSETNVVTPLDLAGIAGLSPHGLEPARIEHLGNLLTRCLSDGGLVEEVGRLLALEVEAGHLERLDAARILFAGGQSRHAGDFLPAPDEAVESGDRACMNLVARFHQERYAEEERLADLEVAWRTTQAALAEGELEKEVEQDALERAVALAPAVREELGEGWLHESFTERPERGMQILAVIGATSSEGLVERAREADRRLRTLELQTAAAEALLAAAPERAADWAPTLELLAGNWLREAEYSYQNDQSTRRGPSLERDPFGNFFYFDGSSRSFDNRNAPAPIATGELIGIRPSDAWLEHVSGGLRPRYWMVLARLLLKVQEESEAFPFIERVAAAYPEHAEGLVAEFLRVWTNNHDPNSRNRRTSSYVYFYGFEQRADAIPLTRSKQERNLVELSSWVQRLRRLPVELDEALIANAFTRVHSTAEVYRLETIEEVFGSMEDLQPATLADLAQRMRANLVGVWRDPNVQRDAGTKRRQKDIEREVLRGYEVTRGVLERALADHPDEWSLVLARASLMHDENNYMHEVKRSSEFSSRRRAAFDEFARAAALYRGTLAELEPEDETTRVHELWFYAALGACDLEAVTSEMVTADSELERIRADLEAIGGEAGERHVATLASTLFTRMSNVNPAVKFRYVRAGLGLVGDHERAAEAREVHEYYEDLVTEIRLETRIDGSDRVGHEEPFGVWVDLFHTREIEREAGGFAKYLTNQNNQGFGFNYGRPTENYRDKFEESARELLSEHFEVLSITFNHPDTTSRADERYGWRTTPYAYLLLRARGPEVDRLPSLRLDLDFLDTTGYAVLPVESPALPMDASGARDPRPCEGVELVQTLDERQAREGRLLLEIQARASGLVPDLERLVELGSPGFEVQSVEDQGVSVTQFDEESDEVRVLCDRTWTLTLRAAEDLEELPAEFTFARPLDAATRSEYQRYVDADLEQVEPVVALEARYGRRAGPGILGWGLALLAVGVVGFLGLRQLRGGDRAPGEPTGLRAPEPLTPFTVIGFLRQVESSAHLDEVRRRELEEALVHLEGHYFRGDAGQAPDLEALVRTWLARAR